MKFSIFELICVMGVFIAGSKYFYHSVVQPQLQNKRCYFNWEIRDFINQDVEKCKRHSMCSTYQYFISLSIFKKCDYELFLNDGDDIVIMRHTKYIENYSEPLTREQMLGPISKWPQDSQRDIHQVEIWNTKTTRWIFTNKNELKASVDFRLENDAIVILNFPFQPFEWGATEYVLNYLENHAVHYNYHRATNHHQKHERFNITKIIYTIDENRLNENKKEFEFHNFRYQQTGGSSGSSDSMIKLERLIK